MKLFKPQVQLVRTSMVASAPIFHLHTVTLTDNTSYIATGHEVATELDEDGLLMITLYIDRADEELGLDYFTPVVHTFTIGELPFEDGEYGILNVRVVDQSITAKTTDARGGTHVGSADADEDDRPIG